MHAVCNQPHFFKKMLYQLFVREVVLQICMANILIYINIYTRLLTKLQVAKIERRTSFTSSSVHILAYAMHSKIPQNIQAQFK